MGEVAAVVLAAGESRRMGVPKMALAWGDRTVISQVVGVVRAAGVSEVMVITGGAAAAVREALAGEIVHMVPNEQYRVGEMLSSVQRGLEAALGGRAEAALIVLGDQPQIQPGVVQKILDSWRETGAEIIVPSFQMRRGHPWLLARSMWQTVIELKPGETMRDFLNRYQQKIMYLTVESDSILQDLDTPEAYESQRPK